jgi:hypothetical protein
MGSSFGEPKPLKNENGQFHPLFSLSVLQSYHPVSPEPQLSYILLSMEGDMF